MEYLREIDSKQHLKHFEDISVYEQDSASKEYQVLTFKARLNFRTNLKRLIVPYYDGRNVYTIDHGEIGDALDLLPCFRERLIVKK